MTLFNDFSVVLPVFNGAGTLGRSLRSIGDQALAPREVIVVDDGSTDGTHGIVEEFTHILPLVHIRLPENRGLVNALQTGVTSAISSWVARLDADDMWLPNHLSSLAGQISDGQALVASRALIVAEDGAVPSSGPMGSLRARLHMCWDNPFVHSAVAFSREHYARVGGYRRTRFEDYDLWSRLSTSGRCSISATVSVLHFKSRGSLSDIARHEALSARFALQRQHWKSLPLAHRVATAPALAVGALRS